MNTFCIQLCASGDMFEHCMLRPDSLAQICTASRNVYRPLLRGQENEDEKYISNALVLKYQAKHRRPKSVLPKQKDSSTPEQFFPPEDCHTVITLEQSLATQ